MRIGNIDGHCEECLIKNFCKDSFDTLYLCHNERLASMREETYLHLAEESEKCSIRAIRDEIIKHKRRRT